MIRISYNNFQDLWERGTYFLKNDDVDVVFYAKPHRNTWCILFCSFFFKVVYNTLACLREATVVALNDDWQKQ